MLSKHARLLGSQSSPNIFWLNWVIGKNSEEICDSKNEGKKTSFCLNRTRQKLSKSYPFISGYEDKGICFCIFLTMTMYCRCLKLVQMFSKNLYLMYSRISNQQSETFKRTVPIKSSVLFYFFQKFYIYQMYNMYNLKNKEMNILILAFSLSLRKFKK